MSNESDDRRYGLRTYDVHFPDGTTGLIVGVVIAGEEVCKVPGPFIARLRALLQRLEADYPGRTGTDTGVNEILKVEILTGRVDVTKAEEN